MSRRKVRYVPASSVTCSEKSISTSVESFCDDIIYQPPEQVYLLAMLNKNLEVTSPDSSVIIDFDKVTTTNPCHYCKGVFTVPKCGDGIYNIVVAATGVESLTSYISISLVVVDSTQLFSNTLMTVTLNIAHLYQNITINYPLKEGYKVYVTASGADTLDSTLTYFNLTRVAA